MALQYGLEKEPDSVKPFRSSANVASRVPVGWGLSGVPANGSPMADTTTVAVVVVIEPPWNAVNTAVTACDPTIVSAPPSAEGCSSRDSCLAADASEMVTLMELHVKITFTLTVVASKTPDGVLPDPVTVPPHDGCGTVTSVA